MNFTSGPFKVIGEGSLESKNSPLMLEISDRGFDFLVPEEKADRFPTALGIPPEVRQTAAFRCARGRQILSGL